MLVALEGIDGCGKSTGVSTHNITVTDTVAPTLAALAGRCTAFTEAYASYASTMQSVLGLMTSRYASLSQDTGYCRHLPMHKSSSVSVAGVLGRSNRAWMDLSWWLSAR